MLAQVRGGDPDAGRADVLSREIVVKKTLSKNWTYGYNRAG
jgi:hypothetical protein